MMFDDDFEADDSVITASAIEGGAGAAADSAAARGSEARHLDHLVGTLSPPGPPVPGNWGRQQLSWIDLRGKVIIADPSHFLDVYDRSLLSMDKMTPEQQEGYNDCIAPGAAGLAGDVDLSGPAGSGKSYVGIHVMQQVLNVDESAHVLLVVQNSAFAYFIAKWLLLRLMAN
jgi:hypothetical protein